MFSGVAAALSLQWFVPVVLGVAAAMSTVQEFRKYFHRIELGNDPIVQLNKLRLWWMGLSQYSNMKSNFRITTTIWFWPPRRSVWMNWNLPLEDRMWYPNEWRGLGPSIFAVPDLNFGIASSNGAPKLGSQRRSSWLIIAELGGWWWYKDMACMASVDSILGYFCPSLSSVYSRRTYNELWVYAQAEESWK